MTEEIKNELNRVKSEIDNSAKLEYHKKFLEITGYKVGDIVKAYFHVSHGSSKQSYSCITEKEAYLKQHPNGLLYLESVEKLQKSYSDSNGRSGRSYRGWWAYEMVIMAVEISEIIVNK